MKATLEAPRRSNHHQNIHPRLHHTHSSRVTSSRKSSRSSANVPPTSARRHHTTHDNRHGHRNGGSGFLCFRACWRRFVQMALFARCRGNRVQEEIHQDQQQREGSGSHQGSLGSESSYLKIRVREISLVSSSV